MSMIGNYLRLPETVVTHLVAEPESIMAFLYPEEPSQFPAARHLDIDKAWHIIHFLLTGDPWGGREPLHNAVLGGKEIGEVDVGYGPARYLTPPEVQTVAEALLSISPESLWSRFHLQAVRDSDIYPSSWEGSDVERDYTQNYFSQLRTFFDVAAKQNEAVVIYIN